MFEWDPVKAEANLRKHGVSFDEAATVFLDPEGLDGPDELHSHAESRRRRLGTSVQHRVLIVAYTVRRTGHAETIRLISARHASRRERAAYRAKD
ncbi:MAG TPA: BrnT family toxin [Vicinamibacterales bacterium]|nr:BrnT family toxin [Vicinamibacterales bacterium]